MSSGMFRGKESSNRIELSRLVKDLLNFGVLGSLWLGGLGVDGWGWGWLGGTPTHVHMHTDAHMCMHAHAHMVNMIISCKWPPQLGESMGIPYDDVICAYTCVCVHAYAHVWGTPYPHPHTPPPPSTHPPTPSTHPPHPHPLIPPLQGGTPGITQNSIVLELIKIFQFYLKIWNLWRLPHPWVGVWFGVWVGGWVDGWDQVKTLKI